MAENPRKEMELLVAKYEAISSTDRVLYNEANTKSNFIQPFFKILGWDFEDIKQVEAEKTIVKGRVDYLCKHEGISMYCIEAKSLRDKLTDDDRKQAITYAYNKGITWAVLTNFSQLQVFNAKRESSDIRHLIFINLTYENYLNSFEKVWLLSKDSVTNGLLDKEATEFGKLPLRIPIEQRLYNHLRVHRELFFNEIYKMHRSKGVTLYQADKLIQELFNRLLFIRTAEDRHLAGNHPLQAAAHLWRSDKDHDLLARIREIFREFTELYNSDLFPSVFDQWQQLWISNQLLYDFIQGLYEVPKDFARYDFAVIDADVLGQVYEQYLGYVAQLAKEEQKKQQAKFDFAIPEIVKVEEKKGRRKSRGIYYTPRWVTDYIVNQTLCRFIQERSDEVIDNVSVLDLACGSGSFLIRAYDELLRYHALRNGVVVSDMDWKERIAVLTNNIYGVDIDSQAVDITRLNLLIRALAKADSLPSLSKSIKCGNSLISGTEEELTQAFGDGYKEHHPFYWAYEFPEITKQGGFDIVIGNPPYIMELRDNKELFRELRQSPIGQRYYEPKMDIFYFFIEHGLDLLKDGGYLGYIVQEYWISRAHAKKLRRKIFDDSLPVTIVDFKEFPVFKEATGQHNMVVILKKTQQKIGETLVLNLKSSNTTEQEIVKSISSDVGSQDLFEPNLLDTSKLYDRKTDKVYLASNTISNTRVKLSDNSWNLDSSEIQQGLVAPQLFLTATSLSMLQDNHEHKKGEGIFVLSKSEFEQYEWTKDEHLILKPFHYAEELDKYKYDTYDSTINNYVIYTTSNIAKAIFQTPEKYPNIANHLGKYTNIMTSDNRPYGLHRARQPEWFEDLKKIIVVRKTRHPKFVVVPKPWYGDQSIMIIRLTKHVHFSPYFLTALFNSRVGHFWFLQQKRQGNQLQIDKEVLLNFPIPNLDLSKNRDKAIHDGIVVLSKKMHDLVRELAMVKAKEDMLGEKMAAVTIEINQSDESIEQKIAEVYRITEEDQATILESIP